MKRQAVIGALLLAALIAGTAGLASRLRAADGGLFQTVEFATIRWDGRENTHLTRPSGQVERLGPLLMKAPRPDRTDERAFYLNLAMNALAKEGFEFAGMTEDRVVMSRAVGRKAE